MSNYAKPPIDFITSDLEARLLVLGKGTPRENALVTTLQSQLTGNILNYTVSYDHTFRTYKNLNVVTAR
jgi:hypothetical protein